MRIGFLDFNHVMQTEEDVTSTIDSCRSVLSHVQHAGVPGRHEPDLVALPYCTSLRRLETQGYAGYIGCEYMPQTGTRAGLDWGSPYLQEAAT